MVVWINTVSYPFMNKHSPIHPYTPSATLSNQLTRPDRAWQGRTGYSLRHSDDDTYTHTHGNTHTNPPPTRMDARAHTHTHSHTHTHTGFLHLSSWPA